MEDQQQKREATLADKQSKEENMFTRDNSNDFSSGPFVEAADDGNQEPDKRAADDEEDE